MTPPSTWLDAASGLTIRPTSWTATTRSTATTPVPGIDRDLGDLAAEGVDAEAVGIRPSGAGPVDRRVAELGRHLDDVLVERAVARTDPPARDGQVLGRDLEDVRRKAQQLATHLAGRAADGRQHRRGRHRAARDRAVEIRLGVAAARRDTVECQPELLRRDDPRRGQRPGADVLDAGRDERATVGVEADRRVGGRAATAPPDLRRAAHSAEQPVGVRLLQRVPPLPPCELGRAVVAGEQLLARVRQARSLVVVDVVPAPQLERVEVERGRQLVDRLVEDGDAFHDTRSAECILRAEARAHREDHRPHVGAGVERQCRLRHGEDPPACAHLDDCRELDRLERPVAAGAKRHGLTGPSPTTADELVLVPRQHEPHRSPRGPRELGGEKCLDSGALLGAEPTADELGDDPHLLGGEPEPGGKLAPRVEHALGRHPRRQPVAVPARDGGVRLERGLDMSWRLALELDDHLCRREGIVRVTPHRLARVLGEPLLVEPAVELERRQLLDLERERSDAGIGVLERVRGDGGDRRAGPGGLAGEHALPAHRERPLRPEHDADAGHGARGVEIEVDHAAARDGRAHDACMEHPGEGDVHREAGRAARPQRPVLPGRRLADDVELGRLGPRLEVVVLVDERPDVLEAPLHLPLGPDEPGPHSTSCPDARRIARSIFGYAPQRQMLPARATRIWSRVGRGVSTRSAVADTICPGVQNPHWRASSATNAS